MLMADLAIRKARMETFTKQHRTNAFWLLMLQLAQ